MIITTITEAKASLSRLIESVQSGQEIIIGKAGKPIAKLSAYYGEGVQDRELNNPWQGKVRMVDDFDDISDEIIAMFEGDA